MLLNAETIALQISRILYAFVLRAEKYTKFAKFEVLYFPHFTTFRDQTLQFYQLKDALSSCCDGFRSSCPDQNFIYSWNHPLY